MNVSGFMFTISKNVIVIFIHFIAESLKPMISVWRSVRGALCSCFWLKKCLFLSWAFGALVVFFATQASEPVVIDYKACITAIMASKDTVLKQHPDLQTLRSFFSYNGPSYEGIYDPACYKVWLMPDDMEDNAQFKKYLDSFCSALSKDLWIHYKQKSEIQSMRSLIVRIWGFPLGDAIFTHFLRRLLENAHEYAGSFFWAGDTSLAPSLRVQNSIPEEVASLSDAEVVQCAQQFIEHVCNQLIENASLCDNNTFITDRFWLLLTLQQNLGLGTLFSEVLLTLYDRVKKRYHRALYVKYRTFLISQAFFIVGVCSLVRKNFKKMPIETRLIIARLALITLRFKRFVDIDPNLFYKNAQLKSERLKKIYDDFTERGYNTCKTVFDLEKISIHRSVFNDACTQKLPCEDGYEYTYIPRSHGSVVEPEEIVFSCDI